MLFLNREIVLRARVKVLQWDRYLNLHILSATLTASLPEMAPATKEAGEEIEGIVVGLPPGLLMSFETLMAVLIIDFAGFRRGEGIVRFGYGNKFVVGRGVVAVKSKQNVNWIFSRVF